VGEGGIGQLSNRKNQVNINAPISSSSQAAVNCVRSPKYSKRYGGIATGPSGMEGEKSIPSEH
jgi:hypothetical protein